MLTVYPKKYAHGVCFAVLCCGYTLTDFLISIRLISLALWQSNDCPSASKATLMNMDKYFMWIHYERLHNHNKAKHNKTVCIFLGIYCIYLLLKAQEVIWLTFHELSKITSWKYAIPEITFRWEFEAGNIYVVCPKPCFGHTWEVPTWISHKKYDFCNTQISSE